MCLVWPAATSTPSRSLNLILNATRRQGRWDDPAGGTSSISRSAARSCAILLAQWASRRADSRKVAYMPDRVIHFYSTRDAYGCFSNFAPYPITLKGKLWPTSEHYFQAQKFAGTEHEEAIRLVKSPTIAARMGRSRQRPLRADWDALTLPTPEGRGCSGDACGTPLRERLRGQPGPTGGWSVVERLRSSGRTGSAARTEARNRQGHSSPWLKTGAFWP
jgi:NADAR domain